MILKDKIFSEPGRLTIAGAPSGVEAIVVAALARRANHGVLHIARDAERMADMTDALGFFAPDIDVIEFPAWDCLPYDRVSPNPEIESRRMSALSRLARMTPGSADKFVLLTTVNAALQRVPARALIAAAHFSAQTGDRLDQEALIDFLMRNGFSRTGTVREPGEFAIRGGLIDLYAPGGDEPLRLDLFGDALETIRTFDAASQRTTGSRERLDLVPVSEIQLDEAAISRFRAGYVAAFGPVTDGDPLYEAVSAGRKHQGMEHWLPLFHERLDTIFDYVPDGMITFDHLLEEARDSRLSMIEDYYEARAAGLAGEGAGSGAFAAPAYKPLKPGALFLDRDEWTAELSGRPVRLFSPYKAPEDAVTIDAGGRPGRDFAPERAQAGKGENGINVFDALAGHVSELSKSGKRVVLASNSAGARDRLSTVLDDHGIKGAVPVETWAEAQQLDPANVALIVLTLEHGFETPEYAIVAEQDVLGDRLVRRRRTTRRAENFLKEASSLSEGDLVVHVDHGIGRYDGLETLDVAGAPHDCLRILYHGGDKLYLPVENIELLSRFGSEDEHVQLDRLGGTGWQQRKARLKKRIREIAEELIKVAAARELRSVSRIAVPDGAYTEFCARFPYNETDDQDQAIASVEEDLGRGRPMDRLICGDVGFGKTEVALRSAFLTTMAGKQVAVIVPTTLLARQHFQTFAERFAGFPVRIEQLSRFVPQKKTTEIKQGLADGRVDIVIGTHALLNKSIRFRDLALVVVDEEQHFGVAHKERLKQLRAEVHVLTLTATPIPRTLQLALTGVRDLSIIATPPVDRLAVRTFVLPFDPVVIREALLREHYRGGQSFYVCPRIADLPDAHEFLKETVPEVKVAVAHGQMPTGQLDDVMNAFYDGKYDVLLCTTIVESGLDIPTANTLIIHRADMFGLAQLYQLRGRVGRSKLRAFAYLTLPPRKRLTETAQKRLKVLQSLDALGAGFSLASHDLDIRGAGNLLGEEQSGHIKEVGLELYQEMLEEAVATLRAGSGEEAEEQWSPQISIGMPVLIPDHYVADLDVRLALYRRLSQLDGQDEIESFAAELIDRFGALPEEVENLLKVVGIKHLCREAGIEKLEAGPKGATLQFRANQFANPLGLVEFINTQAGTTKLRPDHTLVYKRDWESPDARLMGAHHLARSLARLAGRAEAA